MPKRKSKCEETKNNSKRYAILSGIALLVYVGATVIGLIIQTVVAVLVWGDPFSADGIMIDTLIAATISGVAVFVILRHNNISLIEPISLKNIFCVGILTLIGEVCASSIILSGITNIVQSDEMFAQMNVWDYAGGRWKISF